MGLPFGSARAPGVRACGGLRRGQASIQTGWAFDGVLLASRQAGAGTQSDMQERYLGDSHDFIKYALLRHFAAELGLRLGINWYLTRPEEVDKPGNNDGGKRHHLKGGTWRETDPELFDRLALFDDPELRSLENVAALEILPANTAYHSVPVPVEGRADWQGDAMKSLADSDLVFLDPDNGFEVPSKSRRTAPKYATFQEAADYYRCGKLVVGIQFARQCDPIQRAADVRTTLMAAAGAVSPLPVVRARVAPNILFVTIAPAQMHAATLRALNTFSQACSKAELIP